MYWQGDDIVSICNLTETESTKVRNESSYLKAKDETAKGNIW